MNPKSRLEILRAALSQLRDESAPPAHILQEAYELHQGAPTIATHRGLPANEVFYLRFAASTETQAALLRTSASGLWTLQIFEDDAVANSPAKSGLVLLRVHEDVKAIYEGLVARVFVDTPDGEHVLGQAVVTDGQMSADISLAGFDLFQRDAINVAFGPARVA